MDPQKTLENEFATLARNMPGFKRRDGQALMVEHIRQYIMAADADDAVRPVSLLEGGTGTGKSIAYMLGVIPEALRTQKKVLLSTATIQLQEQIYRRDLPAFLKAMGLSAQIAHVKGWGRYLCAAKAESAIAAGLPEAEAAAPMLAALQAKEWDGDLDAWKGESTRAQSLAASSGSCTRRSCPKSDTCGAFQSRSTAKDADIVVTNHALALASMLQPDGKDLVGLDPAGTIAVFDEAHQLESVARSALASRLVVTHLPRDLRGITQELEQTMAPSLPRARTRIDAAIARLEEAAAAAEQLVGRLALLPFDPDPARGAVHRFKHGQLPLELADAVTNLLEKPMTAACESIRAVAEAYTESAHAGGSLEVRIKEHESLLAGILATAGKALAAARRGEVQALWATRSDRGAIELDVAPAEVGDVLAERLFSRPAGTVLTSATLQVLGNFEHFKRRIGLLEHPLVATLGVSSPFDYKRQGLIVTPPMRHEPSGKDTSAFEQELVEKLPLHLCKERGTLVLFTSKAMMERVYAALPSEIQALILRQGEAPKEALLEKHRHRIAGGQSSALFGLGSMAEGLDLPGALCSHVIITRLSFEVPTDPVVATMTEVIETRGGSPFNELALPECATRLVQSAGRLVRTVDDWGLITILDKRVVSKRYGKALLDTLPNFPRTTNAHAVVPTPEGQRPRVLPSSPATAPVQGLIPGQFNPTAAIGPKTTTQISPAPKAQRSPADPTEDPMSDYDNTPIIPFGPAGGRGKAPLASQADADSSAAIAQAPAGHADSAAVTQANSHVNRGGGPAEYDDYADLAAATAELEREQADLPAPAAPADRVAVSPAPARTETGNAGPPAGRRTAGDELAAKLSAGRPADRGTPGQGQAGGPAADAAALSGTRPGAGAGHPANSAGNPAAQGHRPEQANLQTAEAGRPAARQAHLPRQQVHHPAPTVSADRSAINTDLVRVLGSANRTHELASVQLRDRDIGSAAALLNYPFHGPYDLENLPPSRSGARETLAALSDTGGEVPAYFTRLANALVDEIDRANLVVEIYSRLPAVGCGLRLGCVSRGEVMRDAEVEQVEPGTFLVTDDPGGPSEVVRLYKDPALAAVHLAISGAVPYEEPAARLEAEAAVEAAPGDAVSPVASVPGHAERR